MWLIITWCHALHMSALWHSLAWGASLWLHICHESIDKKQHQVGLQHNYGLCILCDVELGSCLACPVNCVDQQAAFTSLNILSVHCSVQCACHAQTYDLRFEGLSLFVLRVSAWFVGIMLEQLAPDVSTLVVNRLPSSDRVRLAEVCKAWKEIALREWHSCSIIREENTMPNTYTVDVGPDKFLKQLALHSSKHVKELRIYWGQRALSETALTGKPQAIPELFTLCYLRTPVMQTLVTSIIAR